MQTAVEAPKEALNTASMSCTPEGSLEDEVSVDTTDGGCSISSQRRESTVVDPLLLLKTLVLNTTRLNVL